MLKVGDQAPAFTLLADNDEMVSLADFKGKKVVLYFYPKDHTPGCTKEACDFRDDQKALTQKGAVVLGISKDTVSRHQSFKKAHSLPFLLLADVEGKVCASYNVIKQKSMFGKKYMGIERSTFLIDEKGKIKQIWSKVKVLGHSKQVLAALD